MFFEGRDGECSKGRGRGDFYEGRGRRVFYEGRDWGCSKGRGRGEFN